MDIKSKIVGFVKNPNFLRAAIIYAVSLVIGFLGFFIIGKPVGDYVLTCFPGFASGISIAFLSNGHKEPVTLFSVIKSTLTIIAIGVICALVGISLFAVLAGAVLGFIGSLVGHGLVQWENNAIKKKNTEEPAEEDQKTQ